MGAPLQKNHFANNNIDKWIKLIVFLISQYNNIYIHILIEIILYWIKRETINHDKS